MHCRIIASSIWVFDWHWKQLELLMRAVEYKHVMMPLSSFQNTEVCRSPREQPVWPDKLACNAVSVAGMSATCSDCGSIGWRSTETYLWPARHCSSVLRTAGEWRGACPRFEKAAKLMSRNYRRSVRNGEQQVPATAILSFAVVSGIFSAGLLRTVGCRPRRRAVAGPGSSKMASVHVVPASLLRDIQGYCMHYCSRVWCVQ